MKNITAIALFAAATLITAGSALAQNHQAVATVPFNFTVGDRTVPAGTYTISSDISSPGLLAVNSWDKNVHVYALGQRDQENPQHANRLVFDKIGDKYYLRDIRTSSSSLNMHLAISKAEKKAKSQVEEAGLFVNDPVLIALN